MKARISQYAIIGGGAGMIAILQSLLSNQLQDAEITIFNHKISGIGQAYRFSPDQLTMNTWKIRGQIY